MLAVLSLCFFVLCLCLCEMLISPRKTLITPLFFSPPFVIIPWGLLVIAIVCMSLCLYVRMPVCVWREADTEKTKTQIESRSLIGNVRKKTLKQMEERRRERLLLIYSAVVRGRCLRLRSHYLLSRLSEAVKPTGKRILKQHSLSGMVNMRLINMYSVMSLVDCCECMWQKW